MEQRTIYKKKNEFWRSDLGQGTAIIQPILIDIAETPCQFLQRNCLHPCHLRPVSLGHQILGGQLLPFGWQTWAGVAGNQDGLHPEPEFP